MRFEAVFLFVLWLLLGTYAIIGGIDGQDIMERILSGSGSDIDSDEPAGYEIDEDGVYGYGDDFVYDFEIVDDKTILTVIRPYTDHLSYDFYRFMTCKRTWIGVIAAKGDNDEWGYHGENNRGNGIIENHCCVLPSTTMYDESTTIMTTDIVEETEIVDEMTTMMDVTTTEGMSMGFKVDVQSVMVFVGVVVGIMAM